jgi:adenylate cyclase, class 2
MPKEVEIKLRVKDLKAFLRALKKLGAKPASPRMHEQNLIFDTPDGGLAKHGQLLRIRVEIPAHGAPGTSTKAAIARNRKNTGAKKAVQRTLLTFKSPPENLAIGRVVSREEERYKVREEIELELTDGASLQRIFEGLGLKGWFRYEKLRTAYRLPARSGRAKGLVIDVDETPIGTFVELEGPGEAIDRAARALGFTPRDYILKNYLALYLEDCKRQHEPIGNMVFS